MKYFFLFIFFFASKNTLALEMSCLFEEVHHNGDTHQGILITKDDKFRYQYFSKNLYTIIYKKNSFFYVENSDNSKFFKIKNNTDMLKTIIDIIKEFPNIKKEHYFNDTIIRVEHSETEKIIRRIIVLSDQIKMNIYLNDCKNVSLKDFYFSWSPFWEYKY